MKKCRVCREPFAPLRPFQTWCCPDHAIVIAQAKMAKSAKVAKVTERKADAVKREKLKRRADWIADAQTAFNAFIRLRDKLAGHACISSGKPLDWTGNAVDAGHYRSRGSAPHLRFDERNCHAQSKQENRYASGNVTGYRMGLIERIGQEAVDALESDQVPRRYGIEDLKVIKAIYTAKAKQLKAEQS